MRDGIYSTEKELYYLSYQCGLMREVPRMSRLKHLIAYREAMKLRSNWGTLKVELIAQHVTKLIEDYALHPFGNVGGNRLSKKMGAGV